MKSIPETIVRCAATIVWIGLAMAAGCDDRAAQIAREAADRQAQQNQDMARLHREVAAGAKRLVEEEAKARQQAFAAHSDLHEERSHLSAGWNDLEAERRAIAGSRRTDSMLAALLSGGGAVAAALLSLALAWLTLFGLRRRDDADGIGCELLVSDLVSDSPQGDWLTPPLEPDRRGALLSHVDPSVRSAQLPSTEDDP